MSAQKVAPYGAWESPISSDLIVAGAIGLGQIQLAGDAVYWTESRPTENGRTVLVRWTPANGQEELTPAGFSVRTRVHEYGGGAFAIHDDVAYFANYSDQRLYVQYPHAEPEPLTNFDSSRFADGIIDARRGRFLCVREQHQAGREAVNSLVSINLDSSEETGDVLVSGHDFYAAPRLSADGNRLAWIAWNHPQMPWDGTELWLADVDEVGQLHNQRCIAGGTAESITQPRWAPDGSLFYVSDRSNWWNLYRWCAGETTAICPLDAEFAAPPWRFSQSSYDLESASSLICSYVQNGTWALARLDLVTGSLTPFDLPFTAIANLCVTGDHAVFTGGSAVLPTAVIRLHLPSGRWQVLRQATELTVDRSYLSTAQPISFPTDDGNTAYGIFYPPQNDDFAALENEKPPLLVLSHGGPTSAARTTLKLGLQYWTSRGFAVLDVNYRGSTGYGRAYRQALNGKWGVADVADCISGARFLADQGLVDGDRLAISGGSAGGYTTLCALTFHDVFRAGASYYGVSDVEVLAKETHKFESRYLDNLIGPYPAAQALYHARSPIHFVDQIDCPLILFQGLEDEVVPPNQSEMMYTAVKAKGVPVAYVTFEAEAHGFRRADNIKRALDAELYFYGRVFQFEPADDVTPVTIDNLPAGR